MHATGKSGSKWLDRLRLSKGFPAGNDLDLDHFLTHHNQNLSNSSNTNLSDANIRPESDSISAKLNEELVFDRNQATETAQGNKEQDLFNVMSNVLAELFNMGESKDLPRINGKKSSRKQVSPKIWVVSDSTNTESKSGDNSLAEREKIENDLLRLMQEENVDEDVKSPVDLTGFSRTEVTVIDTSYPWWKCEKLLFRKKNVWKVRDKKSKSVKIGMKKRMARSLEGGNAGGRKKLKLCGSAYEEHEQSDKINKDTEETPDTLRLQSQKQRFPRKSKKGSSNAVVVKSTLASKKNGQSSTRVAGS